MIKRLLAHIKLHREAWIFWMIAAAGLLLRFEYLREFAGEIYCRFAIGADIQEYHERALEILGGKFFPDDPEIHAPLYSFALALFYSLSGTSVIFVRFFQLLLNWGAYTVIAGLVGRMSGSVRLRNIFLVLAMFTPVLFFHQAELVSESLLAPLTAGCLYMLYAAGKNRRWYAGAGAAAGALVLTHGLLVFFAAGEAVYFLCRKQWKNCGAFIAGCMLLIVPVVVVKSIYYGKFTGIQNNSTYNLWIGNNPDATGGCYLRPGRSWQTPLNNARTEAAERGVSENRIFAEKVLDFYCHAPAQLVILPLKKMALLLSPAEPVAGADPECLIRRTMVQKLGAGMMAAVVLLAICGIFFAVKKREKLYVHFYLLAGSCAAGLLLTVVSGRYRQGMMPGVLLLAALGAYYLGKAVWAVAGIPAVSGAVIALLYTCSGIPCNGEAASIIGEAYFRIKDFGSAEDYLMLAEKHVDHPGRFHNMLGAIAEEKGDIDTAVARYMRAVQEAPDEADGFLNLAHLRFYRFPAQRQEALDLIRRALEIDAALPSAYDMLGQHLAQRGDISGALKMFETACQYEPENELYQKKVNICRQILSAKEKSNAPESRDR
ncbi:MAG: hypothetical protein E7058_08450 [Lentisphaerae bacterium]|nr:hypothetical protein [Lentisphaerota bacterium]